MLSQEKKLRHKILKWLLHRKSGTTLSNLKRIIPELTKVIKTIPSEGKSEREILHTALKKMGWTTKDIKKLSQKTERHKAQDRNISPSFAIQDKKMQPSHFLAELHIDLCKVAAQASGKINN